MLSSQLKPVHYVFYVNHFKTITLRHFRDLCRDFRILKSWKWTQVIVLEAFWKHFGTLSVKGKMQMLTENMHFTMHFTPLENRPDWKCIDVLTGAFVHSQHMLYKSCGTRPVKLTFWGLLQKPHLYIKTDFVTLSWLHMHIYMYSCHIDERLTRTIHGNRW